MLVRPLMRVARRRMGASNQPQRRGRPVLLHGVQDARGGQVGRGVPGGLLERPLYGGDRLVRAGS